jgi:hypothetical protein
MLPDVAVVSSAMVESQEIQVCKTSANLLRKAAAIGSVKKWAKHTKNK